MSYNFFKVSFLVNNPNLKGWALCQAKQTERERERERAKRVGQIKKRTEKERENKIFFINPPYYIKQMAVQLFRRSLNE